MFGRSLTAKYLRSKAIKINIKRSKSQQLIMIDEALSNKELNYNNITPKKKRFKTHRQLQSFAKITMHDKICLKLNKTNFYRQNHQRKKSSEKQKTKPNE